MSPDIFTEKRLLPQRAMNFLFTAGDAHYCPRRAALCVYRSYVDRENQGAK